MAFRVGAYEPVQLLQPIADLLRLALAPRGSRVCAPFGPDWQPLPNSTTVPQTKADCKNGGWKDFGFKNQGQCIKAVKKPR
jgi:hypothetical protein